MSQTYPLDSMKTQAQNRLVGVGAKRAASAMMTEAGKAAMNTNLSKWKGIEMVLLRSAVQSMIQMTMFEEIKRWIDGLKFSDGTMKLPHIERELGRDQKINKKRSEQ
jgi:Mitochondrial carrier protein